MEKLPDLGPTARRVAAVAAAVDDGRLGGPTPCPDYAVRNMLGHLLQLSTAFAAAARKDTGPATSTPPTAGLADIDGEGRWRQELPARLEEMAEAWRDPAAWQGATQVGGVHLPGDQAGMFGLNEILVHGWDLARAAELPYAPDDEALRVSYGLLAPFAHDRGADSPFGPPVAVPAGAPLLDQVVGLCGRDPGWTP
jgi:uncharacterized protein (TIGR03086 family)